MDGTALKNCQSHGVCAWVQGTVLYTVCCTGYQKQGFHLNPRVLQDWNLRVWVEAPSAGISRSSWKQGSSSGMYAGEGTFCHKELPLFPPKAAPRGASVEMLAGSRVESLLPSFFSFLIALLADTANFQANFLSYLVTQMKVLSYCD